MLTDKQVYTQLILLIVSETMEKDVFAIETTTPLFDAIPVLLANKIKRQLADSLSIFADDIDLKTHNTIVRLVYHLLELKRDSVENEDLGHIH